MSSLKILVIPGSLRSGSHNVRLAATAMAELVQAGVDVTRISLGDFPLPIYDADLEADSGVPKPALDLKRMPAAKLMTLMNAISTAKALRLRERCGTSRAENKVGSASKDRSKSLPVVIACHYTSIMPSGSRRAAGETWRGHSGGARNAGDAHRVERARRCG